MEYRVWVTLLSPSAARLVVTGLVERLYSVSPMGAKSEKPVYHEGPCSTLLAIIASHADFEDEESDDEEEEEEEYEEDSGSATQVTDNKDAERLRGDIQSILLSIGASWHSIVISERTGGCDWTGPSRDVRSRFDQIG